VKLGIKGAWSSPVTPMGQVWPLLPAMAAAPCCFVQAWHNHDGGKEMAECWKKVLIKCKAAVRRPVHAVGGGGAPALVHRQQ